MGRFERARGVDGTRDEQELIEHARLWLPLGDVFGMPGLPPRTARAVALAAECGAAVGPVMAAAGAVAVERTAMEAELERVVRPAVGIARGLVALPVVMVPLLAMVLDIDLWAFWTGDPLGRVVGAVVVGMVAMAAAWLRLLVTAATRPADGRRSDRVRGRDVLRQPVLVVVGVVAVAWLVGWWAGIGAGAVVAWRRARHRRDEVLPGLDEVADLAAVAVAAGHDLPAALRLAGARVPDPVLGDAVAGLALRLSLAPPIEPTSAGGGTAARHHDPGSGRGRGIGPLERLVVDLVVTGRPAAAPLRRLATRLRRSEADRIRVAVARLPGRLTFPTALLLVPATVLAIGTPIAMRGLQAIGGP